MIIEFEEKMFDRIEARMETAPNIEYLQVAIYVDIFRYQLLSVKSKTLLMLKY